jgi:DNA-binding GntR family transcriptional regulator
MNSPVVTPKTTALTADSITSALREMILKGQLGIGVQLKQEALAQRFGVSRIPVREALKKLQAEGLIEHTANTGSVVAAKSTQDLLETLDIRIALETRALKIAVPKMTKADIKAARDIIARYDASDSPREWTELNLEFHLCLYRASGRPKLLKMIEDIVRSIDIHLRAHQSSTVGRKSPQTEHKDILKACAAGDADLAVSLLEQHIEHTQRALLGAENRP